jgi:hypothetical protein
MSLLTDEMIESLKEYYLQIRRIERLYNPRKAQAADREWWDE